MGMLQVAFDAPAKRWSSLMSTGKSIGPIKLSAELFVSGVPIQVLDQNLADVLKLSPLGASAKAALQLLDDQTLCPDGWRMRCEVLVSMGKHHWCTCCVGGQLS